MSVRSKLVGLLAAISAFFGTTPPQLPQPNPAEVVFRRRNTMRELADLPHREFSTRSMLFATAISSSTTMDIANDIPVDSGYPSVVRVRRKP